jgi:hypothetical protein
MILFLPFLIVGVMADCSNSHLPTASDCEDLKGCGNVISISGDTCVIDQNFDLCNYGFDSDSTCRVWGQGVSNFGAGCQSTLPPNPPLYPFPLDSTIFTFNNNINRELEISPKFMIFSTEPCSNHGDAGTLKRYPVVWDGVVMSFQYSVIGGYDSFNVYFGVVGDPNPNGIDALKCPTAPYKSLNGRVVANYRREIGCDDIANPIAYNVMAIVCTNIKEACIISTYGISYSYRAQPSATPTPSVSPSKLPSVPSQTGTPTTTPANTNDPPAPEDAEKKRAFPVWAIAIVVVGAISVAGTFLIP